MTATISGAIAISNLLYRYADLFDAGRLEEAARLFNRGCINVGGHDIFGETTIANFWRSFVILYDDGTPRTRHLVSNPQIIVSDDGQTATCTSQWTVLQQMDDTPLSIIGTGRYQDEFALTGGAWHFTRRTYGKVDFWGDTSNHLTKQPLPETQ